MNSVRVRFAPSPTGSLHIGGARTALFNWLFAQKNQGKLILRLEDTDTNRSTQSSAQGIIEGLKWLGLNWDEGPQVGGEYGPYCQSERLPIYQKFLQQLINENKAYYCFCSPEEIASKRQQAEDNKDNYRYDGSCLNLTPAEIATRLNEGQKPVIRLKSPAQGKTIVHDLIRGEVEFNNALFDDFIIAKSDGWPTYNFAVVIDDYLMKISHVIRAEEHLSNTPKQIMLYKALGFNLPFFAHVSMILSPDRSKLSKRHGATSVQEFRDTGYLPEALINYLVLLGWSPSEDLDLLTIKDMVSRFDLNQMSKAPAIYDIEKLAWMNGQYIAQSDGNRLLKLLIPFLPPQIAIKDKEKMLKIISLMQTRVKTIPELYSNCKYFFADIDSYDEKGVNKFFFKPPSQEILNMVLEIIKGINDFTAENIENALRATAQANGMKAAALIHPTRLALSGTTMTPGLFEIMEIMGQECCLKRINNALDFIKINYLK